LFSSFGYFFIGRNIMSLISSAFYVFAALAIASAVMMITRKNAVSAAVCLILHFFCLSGLYLTLQAQLLSALQIIVYAGAIMVLVVFVIMLLNLGEDDKVQTKGRLYGIAGIVLSGILAVQLLAVTLAETGTANELPPKALVVGSVNELGRVLYTEYLFPFEAVSLLLLTAVVGAVILAKRKLES
jgi:NADH-quinone oxidoreductase subunit J